MRLRRLRARNFRRFAELDIDGLGDGLVAVVGPNESGKSTIGEALVLALAGPAPGWDPVRAIKWETDEAEVAAMVELEDGRQVAVRRTWDRAGGRGIEVHDPSLADGPVTGDEAETHWQSIMGASPNSLRTLLRLPQGEFERLKRGGDEPGERWERLAGVPRLRAAAERAREFAAGAAHRLDSARGDLRAAEALVDELGGAPEALVQAGQMAADATAAIGELDQAHREAEAARTSGRAARERRERLERDLARVDALAGAAWNGARAALLRSEAAGLVAASLQTVDTLGERRRNLGEQRADIERRREALATATRLAGEAAAAAAARARSLRAEPETPVPGGGGVRLFVYLLCAAGLGFVAWFWWTAGAPDAVLELLSKWFAAAETQRTVAAGAPAILGALFALLLIKGLFDAGGLRAAGRAALAAREARDREAAACEALVAGGAAKLAEAAAATRDDGLREQVTAAAAAVQAAPAGDSAEVQAALRAEEDRVAREDAQTAQETERCTAVRQQLADVAGEAPAPEGQTAPSTVAEIDARAQSLLQELAGLPEPAAPPEGEPAPADALSGLAVEIEGYGREGLTDAVTPEPPPELAGPGRAMATGRPEGRDALRAALSRWRERLAPLDALVTAERSATEIADRTRTAMHDAESRKRMAEADCERLRPQAERAKAAREEAQRLGEGLATLAAEEAVAREAADLVQTTIADVIGRLRPALTSLVSLLLPRVTAGRYHAARVGDDLAIRVRSPETGDWIPLMDLSGSASDQVLFCVRTATTQALRAVRGIGPLALPLYLDQPLAAFDDRRTEAFVKLLRALQRETPQVFLASIRDSVAEGADHVLLTEPDGHALSWRPGPAPTTPAAEPPGIVVE